MAVGCNSNKVPEKSTGRSWSGKYTGSWLGCQEPRAILEAIGSCLTNSESEGTDGDNWQAAYERQTRRSKGSFELSVTTAALKLRFRFEPMNEAE